MEHAQLTEEELQQSAALSEDEESQGKVHTKRRRMRDTTEGSTDDDVEMTNADEEAHNHPASEDDASDDAEGEDEDVDADGEADEDYDLMNGAITNTTEVPDDEDAEGEEDDEEGVGAVKVKPGETDDEEEDSASDASESQTADGESDGDAAWEEDDEVAGNEDEDDEESASEAANACIFCRKDPETDADCEPVVQLTCTSCGETGKLNFALLLAFYVEVDCRLTMFA